MKRHHILGFTASFVIALATIAAIHLIKSQNPNPLKYASDSEKPIVAKYLACVEQRTDPLVAMTKGELEALVAFQIRMGEEGKPLLPGPIPLTPELDKNLVNKGVLPSVNKGK